MLTFQLQDLTEEQLKFFEDEVLAGFLDDLWTSDWKIWNAVVEEKHKNRFADALELLKIESERDKLVEIDLKKERLK